MPRKVKVTTKRRTYRKGYFRRAKARRDNAYSLTVRRPMGGFPDVYFAKHKAAATTALSAATTSYVAWNWNNPVTQIGPSINGGSLAVNVPAGIPYLLGSTSGATGSFSNGPYLQARVNAAMITCRYIPTATGPSTISMALVPSDNAITSNWTFARAAEQPYASSITSPGNQTTRPITLKKFQTVRKQLGYKYKSSVEANPNLQISNASTASAQVYFNLMIEGDGTTNLTGQLEWEIVVFMEYWNRNAQYLNIMR